MSNTNNTNKKHQKKGLQALGKKRKKLMRLATYASVFTAFILILAKVIAFVLTGSVAILATMIDSCLDLLASFINMIAIRQATLPADYNHRFGHGKFEPLAGIGQSAFVFGSGLFLMVAALGKIGTEYDIGNINVGIIVMIFSILFTGLLLIFQYYVVKRTDSVAVSADKAHYAGDLLINTSVIISLLLGHFWGFHYSDIIFAIGISLYLMYISSQLFKKSMLMLTDAELPDKERKKIINLILRTEGVKGVHDLRTRSSGDKLFIQCHLELDGKLPLSIAHEIGDKAEHRIMKSFPNAEVLVHHDPHGIKEQHPELWYDLGLTISTDNKKI